MLKATPAVKVDLSHGRRVLVIAALLAGAVLAAAAVASGATTNNQRAHATKLIIMELPFPCSLNQYAEDLCKGAADAAKKLPAGFKYEVKVGTNYEDTQGFNSLIQTSLQLSPAGLIVFPNGVAAQTPFLNKACAQGAKVIFVDSLAKGVKCQVSFETLSAYKEGALAGAWLVAHPPTSNSKEVAIVGQQPGLFSSNDLRVKGFVDTVAKAGYKKVAYVVGTNAINTTQSLVKNMLTAHPTLTAIYSANPFLGDATTLALKGNHTVLQFSTGGLRVDMPAVESGEVAGNSADDPYAEGRTAVKYMVAVLQGKKVPRQYLAPTKLITKANVKQYLAGPGMR